MLRVIICRQFRVLRFTWRREYCKCGADCSCCSCCITDVSDAEQEEDMSPDENPAIPDVRTQETIGLKYTSPIPAKICYDPTRRLSADQPSDGNGLKKVEKRERNENPRCWEYWDKKLDEEEVCDAFLSAISTLTEDAPEIILLVYIIISGGIQQELLGKLHLHFVDRPSSSEPPSPGPKIFIQEKNSREVIYLAENTKKNIKNIGVGGLHRFQTRPSRPKAPTSLLAFRASSFSPWGRTRELRAPRLLLKQGPSEPCYATGRI